MKSDKFHQPGDAEKGQEISSNSLLNFLGNLRYNASKLAFYWQPQLIASLLVLLLSIILLYQLDFSALWGLTVLSFVLAVKSFMDGAELRNIQAQSDNPCLQILSVENEHFCKKDCDVKFTKVVRVKALKDDVDSFVQRFEWTGEITDLLQNKAVQLIHNQADSSGEMRIHFPRSLKKGDQYQFRVELNLNKAEGDERNFLQYSCYYPLEKLKLTVKFCKGDLPFKCTRKILRSRLSRHHLIEKPVLKRDLSEVSWAIKWPRIGYAYRIEWKFNEPDDDERTT